MGFTWTGTEIIKYLSKKFEEINKELDTIKQELIEIKKLIEDERKTDK